MRNANSCSSIEELDRSCDLIGTRDVRRKCDSETNCSGIEIGGDGGGTWSTERTVPLILTTTGLLPESEVTDENTCTWSANGRGSELDGKDTTAADR